MYLYVLYNTATEKGYIGITSRPVRSRLLEHFAVAKKGALTIVARAIRKYGTEAFTLTVLGEAESWEELCAMERAAIVTYNTLKPHGYNITQGGDGALGRLHTDEAKERIGTANRGRKASPETRLLMSLNRIGIRPGPETRKKLSERQLGELNHRYGKTPEHHAKMLEAAAAAREQHGHPTAGRPLSDEHKAKISAANKGKKLTDAQIEILRKISTGRTVSEATKEKLRKTALQQIASKGNPMQGKRHSEATRQLISERLQGMPAWNKGKKTGPLSAEHRAKLSEVHKGQAAWNKGIPWHDIIKGDGHPAARAVEYDGTVYASVMECHKQTGLARNTIRRYIEQGKARYVKD